MSLEKLVAEHLRKDCAEEPVFCKYKVDGCIEIILRKDLENHAIVCDFRPIIDCKVCSTGVNRTN